MCFGDVLRHESTLEGRTSAIVSLKRTRRPACIEVELQVREMRVEESAVECFDKPVPHRSVRDQEVQTRSRMRRAISMTTHASCLKSCVVSLHFK